MRFQDQLVKVKKRNHLSKKIATSAITAETKSSMKSRSNATTSRHLCDTGERNREQKRTKESFGRTMIRALELQRLAKRHISGRSDAKQ